MSCCHVVLDEAGPHSVLSCPVVSQERRPSGCSGTQWRMLQRRPRRRQRAWLQLLPSHRNHSNTCKRDGSAKSRTGDMNATQCLLDHLGVSPGSRRSLFILSMVDLYLLLSSLSLSVFAFIKSQVPDSMYENILPFVEGFRLWPAAHFNAVTTSVRCERTVLCLWHIF